MKIVTDNEFQRNTQVEVDYEAKKVADAIIKKIRSDKDDALFEYIKKFDNYDLSKGLVITDFEIGDAISEELKDALRYAADRIKKFSLLQLQKSWFDIDNRGVVLGEKITAISKAGIYIPGGKAVYPSTMLMNAIPAKVAGVKSIAAATPTSDGYIDPSILFAASIAGVDKIYQMGGAHAIAAMAYGTESVEPVDVIAGPGNRFVAEAKRSVAGSVKIDSVAGPSEVLVYIDNGRYIEDAATDIIAQAEHDSRASISVATTGEKTAEAVKQKIEQMAGTAERTEIVNAALETSRIYVCKSESDAVKLVNKIAPEHLEILSDNGWNIACKVKNAGAIFIGKYSPAAIGDYVAGPNHTLPTGAASRFSSPLSPEVFLKRSSIIYYSKEGYLRDAPAAIRIAEQEGLSGHANSLKMRLPK